MKKLTIKDVELKGKRLLMRVDFNIPLDESQNITDDKRIKAALPTIQYAIEKGAKVILMSHLGRPKGKIVPEMSLKPAAVRLGELLNKDVKMAPDCIGSEVEKMVDSLQEGDVLLLENVRFHKGETENDPAYSKQLAQLGDIYANDAFGSAHRAHGSTAGVTEYFDKCVSGFLMGKELDYLGTAVTNPSRPYVAILGGAKISDKIPVIENLIEIVDQLLIGGGMAYTFIKAQGMEIGNSLLDESSLDFVRRILAEKGDKIVLPADSLITDKLDFSNRQLGQTKMVPIDKILSGWEAVDIGPKTIEVFSEICLKSKTIVWNGPLGVFEIEETSKSTIKVAKLLAELTEQGVTTIIGGGDSASAVKRAGVDNKVTHVSTGGGAALELLQGKNLPGIDVLTDAD
jgi:phosphoglycerate kinase